MLIFLLRVAFVDLKFGGLLASLVLRDRLPRLERNNQHPLSPVIVRTECHRHAHRTVAAALLEASLLASRLLVYCQAFAASRH